MRKLCYKYLRGHTKLRTISLLENVLLIKEQLNSMSFKMVRAKKIFFKNKLFLFRNNIIDDSIGIY